MVSSCSPSLTCLDRQPRGWRAAGRFSSPGCQSKRPLLAPVAQICPPGRLWQQHQLPLEGFAAAAAPGAQEWGGRSRWESQHWKWRLWIAEGGWSSDWAETGCSPEDKRWDRNIILKQNDDERLWNIMNIGQMWTCVGHKKIFLSKHI